MWHFQTDTPGCVLRASEVKPKLDRFLLTKEKPNASWFVKGRTDALDYKLWFVAPAKEPMILKGEYPLFFGNMGEQQQKKTLIFYENKIEMHLFSLNDTLIEKIKKHLFEFFATHSFGTRQDKGFGFFFPMEIDGEKGDFNQPFGAHYQFEINWKDSSMKYVETFKAIHYFHKLIRSGINETNKKKETCYYKSLMYFYAKDKGEQWDKPTIRHHFQLYTKVYQSICGQLKYPYKKYIRKGSQQPDVKIYEVRADMKKEFAEVSSKSKQLFRDALGLASEQKWKAYEDTISIKAQNPNFVRFKSPIMYRPVILGNKCHVYIHWDESSLADLKKQRFTICHKARQRPDVKYRQGKIAPLNNMQVYGDFSLEDYFDFILRRYHNGEITHSGDYENPYIKEIFSKESFNFSEVTNSNPTKL